MSANPAKIASPGPIRAAGGAKIFAEPPRRPGQNPANRPHRGQARCRIRASRCGDAVAHHPVRAWQPTPTPPPMVKALQEADDGLGILGQLGIHPVFVAPEALAIGEIARACPFHTSWRCRRPRRTPFAPASITMSAMAVIVAPGVERRLDRQTHLVGQRIERLGPVERDPARARGECGCRSRAAPAGGAEIFVRFRHAFRPGTRSGFQRTRAPVAACRDHPCPASMSRATISRMISFVPSRI
jgi:hypothetical protein